MSFSVVTREDMEALRAIVGQENYLWGAEISPDYAHDELGGVERMPDLLLRVHSTEEVSRISYCPRYIPPKHRLPRLSVLPTAASWIPRTPDATRSPFRNITLVTPSGCRISSPAYTVNSTPSRGSLRYRNKDFTKDLTLSPGVQPSRISPSLSSLTRPVTKGVSKRILVSSGMEPF